MEYLILDLARILRKSGIPVSTEEVNDCLKVLRQMYSQGLDKHTFYQLINGTMVKR